MKRFADLPPDKRDVWAEKVKISEVIGQEILITGFTILPSKYGEHEETARIDFILHEEHHICYTSSALLRRQLESTSDEMPYLATITRKDNWLKLE